MREATSEESCGTKGGSHFKEKTSLTGKTTQKLT